MSFLFRGDEFLGDLLKASPGAGQSLKVSCLFNSLLIMKTKTTNMHKKIENRREIDEYFVCDDIPVDLVLVKKHIIIIQLIIIFRLFLELQNKTNNKFTK